MKKFLKSIIALTVTAAMIPISGIMPGAYAASSATTVILDPSDASPFNNGEFEGWGTSLCWWANRIGYSEELTQQAADAFFSEDGLGLDIARYNLGGGDDPSHNHITRSDSKIPCYATGIDGDGNITYDWTVDKNQRNVVQAALEANPDLYVEGFSNSPPYFMTNSGCSSGAADANSDNLNPAHYDNFAKFIADVTKHFKDEWGIEFESYSPMNEPDTNYWGANSPKQEGSHYSPGETQSKTIIATRKALDEAGLTDVLVAGMDETDIGKTITNYGKLTDEAKTALGRIDTHTYNGSNRAGVKATAVNAGKDLWMSEVDGGWDGFGLAGRIILDMNGMQPSAWVMWDIIDSHKDANFTAPDGSKPEANNSLNPTDSLWGVGMADHDTKELKLANKYYFFGQFTKYINPGDTIIASSGNTLAAYNKKTGEIKIVALNSSGSDMNYVFDMSAFVNTGSSARVIRSDNADEKWNELDKAQVNDKKLEYTLKARSITTFVVDGLGGETPDAAVTQFTADSNGLSYSYTVSEELKDYNKYFAVYGSDGSLMYLSLNKDTGTAEGNFENVKFKLFVWDEMNPETNAVDTAYREPVPFDKYAIIKGGSSQIKLGASVALSVNTNIAGNIEWSSSDESIAAVTQEGVVTSLKSGNVTIYAKVGDFTTSRDFEIPMYTLTGTASWGSDSSRPADSADYTKAADGDLSTYFDGTTGGWIQYDYGTPFKASKIKLAARSGSGYPERTVGAKVQGSNDGIAWTDLYKITSAVPADSYTEIAADQLENNKAYRYFRYTNSDNMANIAEFLIEGEVSDDTPENDPVITDIDEFTDDFEGMNNIFGADKGGLADGNVVFDSGLDRFGGVFAPVRSTAAAELSEPKTLTDKDRFRLTFNMFAGWESSGKENTFAVKDADGNELAAFKITGGGYTLQEVRIGGKNVLSGTPVAQCRSNPGTSKAGANGWNASGQPYVNTVGYNKTVEIIIDGTGAVSVSLTGGMADTAVDGVITAPVTIGSIELTGDYNSARERVVSYDNLDGDIITYSAALPKPAEPTPTPVPTDPPVLPENGELINMNFDNGDLTSTSSYGKASGTPKFAEVDGRKCIQLDGTAATAVTLTDANGNGLLTGQKNVTVSFKMKPTSSGTSWWFFTAPDAAAQTYQKEKYLGAMTNGGTLSVERYNNSGSRSTAATGTYTANEWNDVMISFDDDVTTLYINGEKKSEIASTVNIADMLGNNPVAYIGRANWGTGEYAAGYIDDFVIKTGAVKNPLGDIELNVEDLSAVTDNITLPAKIEDADITWKSSDRSVILDNGYVIRGVDTKDVVLTATTSVDGIEYTRNFNITVPGYAAVIDTFTAYADGDSIIYSSEYFNEANCSISVTLAGMNDIAVVVEKDTAKGTFDSLPAGTYKISCTLTIQAVAPGDTEAIERTVTKTIKVKEEEYAMEAYLFAHFVGSEKDADSEQIYFSVSTDGTTWTTLKGGKPVLKSTVGETGVRDPYILRGEDGKYFVIATDLSIYERRGDSNRWGTCQTSGSKSIVVWESDDLVNWSEASLVEVAVDNAGCTWAPEAVYDPEKDAYMVFWASKTSDDNYATQRMYRSYTNDFKTFTAPEIYIDGGNVSNIDTTITSHKGVYYRFTKNESKSSVTMMKSTSLSGKWEDVGTYTINGTAGNTVTGYEGPTIYKINGEDKWCLLLDYYSKSQGYKPFVTNDITTGAFTSASDFKFDATYRHGTVMPITQAEYDRLVEGYPAE